MKYKAVIFDLFGTLVDTFLDSEYQQVLESMAEAVNAPAGEFSRVLKDTFDMRVTGAHQSEAESIQYICNQLSVAASEEQVLKASDIRKGYSYRTIVPRPATLPTLAELKKRGYKVGLITDCSPEAPNIWEDTAFAGVFDATVFSCVVRMKKPDPRIYHLACGQLGVKPEECVYVGDGGSNELTGAKQVGMCPVLILDPGEKEDTYFVNREMGWDGPAIATLNEILEMLE